MYVIFNRIEYNMTKTKHYFSCTQDALHKQTHIILKLQHYYVNTPGFDYFLVSCICIYQAVRIYHIFIHTM